MDIGPGKVLRSYLLMRSWFIAVNNGMGEAVRCMDIILGLKNDQSYSLLLTDLLVIFTHELYYDHWK